MKKTASRVQSAHEIKKAKIAEKIESRNNYTYSELNSCKPGTDKVHFYATILDAQFPHKSFKSDKYVCSMKIADNSCHINKLDGFVQHCTEQAFWL